MLPRTSLVTLALLLDLPAPSKNVLPKGPRRKGGSFQGISRQHIVSLIVHSFTIRYVESLERRLETMESLLRTMTSEREISNSTQLTGFNSEYQSMTASGDSLTPTTTASDELGALVDDLDALELSTGNVRSSSSGSLVDGWMEGPRCRLITSIDRIDMLAEEVDYI